MSCGTQGLALDAYGGTPVQDRAFGGVAGTRSALAIARVFRAEIDGAAEALARPSPSASTGS